MPPNISLYLTDWPAEQRHFIVFSPYCQFFEGNCFIKKISKCIKLNSNEPALSTHENQYATILNISTITEKKTNWLKVIYYFHGLQQEIANKQIVLVSCHESFPLSLSPEYKKSNWIEILELDPDLKQTKDHCNNKEHQAIISKTK